MFPIFLSASRAHSSAGIDPNFPLVDQICRCHKLATTQDDRRRLQNLDRLEDWAEMNKILFNSEKCRPLYSGNKNAEHTYTMGDSWLGRTPSKRA